MFYEHGKLGWAQILWQTYVDTCSCCGKFMRARASTMYCVFASGVLRKICGPKMKKKNNDKK
jgi:hypothetical protein